MAFNAFNGVKVSADTEKLFVDGHSDDKFTCVRVEVALIAVGDDDKRVEGSVEGPHETAEPLPASWSVEISQASVEPAKRFGDKEAVYVVGVATSKSGERFIWGGVTLADGSIELPTIIGAKQP